MENSEAKLVEAVRRKREAGGLSLRALSAIVGVSFSTLARIERGDGLPDNNSRIRLIEWLGSEAGEAGLSFDSVALVHFRAAKNVKSATVQALLRAADCLRLQRLGDWTRVVTPPATTSEHPVGLSKGELEDIAAKFRDDLGLGPYSPIDSLKLSVDGIDVAKVTGSNCLDQPTVDYLSGSACSEWSAMSVPLASDSEHWIVLLNDCHAPERQRVTLLEEYWHILLGHRLTRVARIAEAYGRTYDSAEEHDAYYLASSTLLPKAALVDAVAASRSSKEIAACYGTSAELVDYRIKRLGLWREHSGRSVALG